MVIRFKFMARLERTHTYLYANSITLVPTVSNILYNSPRAQITVGYLVFPRYRCNLVQVLGHLCLSAQAYRRSIIEMVRYNNHWHAPVYKFNYTGRWIRLLSVTCHGVAKYVSKSSYNIEHSQDHLKRRHNLLSLPISMCIVCTYNVCTHNVCTSRQ